MQKDKKKLLTKMIVSFLAVGSLYYCGALDRDCFADVPAKSQTGNDNEGQVTFDKNKQYDQVYGWYLDNGGNAENGHVTISDIWMYNNLTHISGGYTNDGSANGNTVDIKGNNIIYNKNNKTFILGAEVENQSNNTVNNNIVNIEDANIYAYDDAYIYGGGYDIGGSEKDGQGTTSEGNTVNIINSSIGSSNNTNSSYVDITGGKGTYAIKNTVKIDDGKINAYVINGDDNSINITGGTGGISHQTYEGSAVGNRVDIINNTMDANIVNIQGGQAFKTEGNNVTVKDVQITADAENYVGINIYGGSSNGGSTTENKVVIENDELSGNDGITIMGGYDSTIGAGEMKGNSVAVNGGHITSKDGSVELYGGLSDNGENATSNSVDITNGNINAKYSVKIYGGQAINTDGNTVAVKGGQITADTVNMYGGSSSDGSATGNSVTANGGQITANDVNMYGGLSSDGSATGNSVIIENDGQITAYDVEVYGGLSYGSSAIENSVKINNANINNASVSIAGGQSSGKGSSQNTVTISGSDIVNSVENTISGAKVGYSEKKAEITNNVVTISGSNIKDSETNTLLGVMVSPSEAGTEVTDNIVNISDSNIENAIQPNVIIGAQVKNIEQTATGSVKGNSVNISDNTKFDNTQNMIMGVMVYNATGSVTGNSVNINNTKFDKSQQNMIVGASVGSGADAEVTENKVELINATIDNATIVGAINGNGAVEGNTVTIENGTISGSIYGGVGSSVKNNVVTIKGKTNLNGADILGSGSIDNNSGDISSTSNGDLDENNTLNLDAWTGKTVNSVNSINNFDTINLNNIVLSDDGSAVLSVNSASDLTDTTININSFADDLDLAKDDSKLIVDGSNITYKAENVGGDLITKDTVYDDKNGSNGVRVYGTALSTEDVTKDGNKDISLTVTKSILAGTYIDSEGKTHSNSESTEPGVLNLNNGSTNADIIAGSYASDANEATGGKVVIDGEFTANETRDIYAGYSENGAVKDNTMTLTANAKVENTNLYGSNKDTDGSNNNSLNIDGFNGTVKSLHNFDNINVGEVGFEDGAVNITSKEASNLKNASLNATFIGTNNTIYDKGENKDVIVLNNISIGDSNITNKSDGDIIASATDNNGVEVNRLNLTTKQKQENGQINTVVNAEVTEHILAGKYTNNMGIYGDEEGKLTIGEGFTTTASTIAGSYSSSADKAAEGGKVTIDGAYTAAKIYAGYSENNGDVKNNTIKLTANADVANTDLYGSNKGTDGSNNNSLNIDGFSGTVNGLYNFDNINFSSVNFDKTLEITANNSNLENATINIDAYTDDGEIYSEGTKHDIIKLNNIKVTNDATGLDNAYGDITKETDNGVHVNRLDIDTNYDGTATTVTATVDKYILAGSYTNNTATYGTTDGVLTLDDSFNSDASTIAGSYSSVADKEATGGTVVVNGKYTAGKTSEIYAGYSENGDGKVSGNTIELQSGADVAKADLYGANDEAVKNNNASNNSLNVDDFSGKVNSLQNFNQIDLGTVKATNETFNKNLDNAVLNVQSKGDLTDTDIKIDDITVDENLDLATGTQKTLIGGNNVTTDETTTISASDEATANKYVQTANGMRVHAFDYGTDNGEVTATVKRSVLTSKYIDENNNAHGENVVHIDDDFQTNAETITGSYAAESNKATGGEVIIDGNYDGKIYAGYSENGDGEVSGNTVTVNSNVNAKDTDLWGRNTDTGKDNNLNVNGKEVVIGSVKYFDNINMNNIEWENNKTVLTIDNGKDSDLSDTNININNLNVQGGATINVNDSMNLISGENLNINGDKINIGEDFTAGVTAVGKGEIVADNNGLSYKIDEVAVNPQTSLIAENRAVATAFINQGSDLIASGLDSLHDQYGYGFKTFAAVYGNRSTYDAGSDLKINGWSEIIGLGSTKRINDGDLDWGVFYENGSGNYRTYNQFNDEFFRGDGSMVYNGGGVAARFTKDNGWYYEGSLRAGTLKSEIDHALKDGIGNTYGYKSDTTYYGAHLGLGKILSLSDSQDLNVYGKYFHTYNDGDDFTIAGDRFSFDSVTSDRIMLGAKLTTNKNNIWQTHYGLAWEYEFNGDSDMTAGQFNLPTQSLKGSTFIGEIGFSYRDDKFSPWSFDLDFKGYQGQRDGFSGHAQVTYNF